MARITDTTTGGDLGYSGDWWTGNAGSDDSGSTDEEEDDPFNDSGGTVNDDTDSGSYGVRDYDADVADGPDEETGTVNLDAISADDRPEEEDTSGVQLDPNATVSQAAGSVAGAGPVRTVDNEPVEPEGTGDCPDGYSYDPLNDDCYRASDWAPGGESGTGATEDGTIPGASGSIGPVVILAGLAAVVWGWL